MAAPSTAFSKQYQDTITLLAQQLNSRVRPAVMVDTNWKGEEKYYDQYASDSMVEITTRLQDTPVQDADHRRRRVTPRYFVSSTLEDPNEALQMLADPKSSYMQAKAAAAARKIDYITLQAIGGTCYTGKTGSTAVSIASAQKTTAGGSLTIAKLLEAKEILDSSEIPKEDRFIAVSSNQLEDLLNTTQATSADYNTVKTLAMGDIDTFCGFKFIHTEQLTAVSTSRYCYAWQKQSAQLAIQREPEGRLTERADKNYAWQVYMRIAMGATRLQEEGVVEVVCVES
jgi:hypothetical protein